ncbi:MAG: sigma-70 family RNA polymerase sigma factor [Oceanipulchritudo sp.]
MEDPERVFNPRGQEALARAACAGDEAAFGKLFAIFYGRIHRTVWGMLGDEGEAHDVTQEAWIKAWKQRERFNFESAFSTWVHRIAVNTALDALRRRKRLAHRLVRFLRPHMNTMERGASEPVSLERGPDRRLRDKELGKEVEKAIAALPEDQRTAFVLREYEGYSYREIAELTGCKTGTVMSRLHLARTKLQARLSKELP